MKPEDVMKHPLNVLAESERRRFFKDGFLVIPDYVSESWLERLRSAMQELIERSREVSRSDEVFVLEQGHSADSPRLHRVANPQDQHEVFWQFFTDPLITGLAADLVGPDVAFHHAKLNVKSGKGSQGFGWHQDIPAWPHTDYSPISIGVYLNGCREDQGPLSFVTGSHLGPLYTMYDHEGRFVVRLRDEDLNWLTDDMITRSIGGPGTVVVLNCRVIHGSAPNASSDPRPLLLPVFSSADSFPYTPSPIKSPRQGDIVRGKPAKYASFDTRPCEMPPDWRAGYRSVWEAGKEEKY